MRFKIVKTITPAREGSFFIGGKEHKGSSQCSVTVFDKVNDRYIESFTGDETLVNKKYDELCEKYYGETEEELSSPEEPEKPTPEEPSPPTEPDPEPEEPSEPEPPVEPEEPEPPVEPEPDPIYYTITFESEEGTEEISVLENTQVELPDAQKDGYKFLGWFNGDTQVTNLIATENIILKAKFEKIPNPHIIITFEYLDQSKIVDLGEGGTSVGFSIAETAPNIESTDTLVFQGWEKPDGTLYGKYEYVTTSESLTIKARFHKVEEEVHATAVINGFRLPVDITKIEGTQLGISKVKFANNNGTTTTGEMEIAVMNLEGQTYFTPAEAFRENEWGNSDNSDSLYGAYPVYDDKTEKLIGNYYIWDLKKSHDYPYIHTKMLRTGGWDQPNASYIQEYKFKAY